MDFFRQVQLFLFSTIIIREGLGNLNETASNDATARQNSSEITALLDFEAGMVYYKDEEQGICFVEFLESVLEDSFVIRVPESGNLSHGIEETSPLAKEFCGSYQVYWIGEFLSQNTRERRKRSPQKGFAPRGGSSQSQVQGQVYGQGLFSGQAQSQASGSSQAQVQLSGAGILGSVSSSTGNANAQIALHERSGSGQAQSSGQGPANSQVQVNIDNGGRGSMASASVNADEALEQRGQYYGKPGWVPGSGSGNQGWGRSEGLWAPGGDGSRGLGFGRTSGHDPMITGRGYDTYNNRQRSFGPAGLQGGTSDWYYGQPNYGSPLHLTHPGVGSSGPFGQSGGGDFVGPTGQGFANLPQLPDMSGGIHRGTPSLSSSTDRFGQLGQTGGVPRIEGGDQNSYVPTHSYTPQQYHPSSGTLGINGAHLPVSHGQGHSGPARPHSMPASYSPSYAQSPPGELGRTTGSRDGSSANAYSHAGGSDVPQSFASSSGGGQAQAQTYPRGGNQASFHVSQSQSAQLSRDTTTQIGGAYGRRNGQSGRFAGSGTPQSRGSEQTYGDPFSGSSHPVQQTSFAQPSDSSGQGQVGAVVDSGRGAARPVSADGYIPFGNGYVRPYIPGTSQQSTSLPQQGEHRFQPATNNFPQQTLPTHWGASHPPSHSQPPVIPTVPHPSPQWDTPSGDHRTFSAQPTAATAYPSVDYSQYYTGHGYERPVWPSDSTARPPAVASGHPTYGLPTSGTGTKHCRVVTFTCTVLIESNGRAKICKPNGNGSNGHHSQESGRGGYQDHGRGLRICCC